MDALIEKAEKAIGNFEMELGWKEENNSSKLSKCPCDSTHLVAPKNAENHASKCKWKHFGYTDEEIEQILADGKLTLNKSIHLETIVARKLPQFDWRELLTHERYISILTIEQRLMIYNEIVSQLKQEALLDPFLYQDLDDKKKIKKSAPNNEIDIMKELRDFKRRRQTYRAKNVHITKRTHTEVLRDVLANHMEQLRLIWNPEVAESSCKSEDDTCVNLEKVASDDKDGSYWRRSNQNLKHRDWSSEKDRTRRDKSPEKSWSRRDRSPEKSWTRRDRSSEQSWTRRDRLSEKHRTRRDRSSEKDRTRWDRSPEKSWTRRDRSSEKIWTRQDRSPDKSWVRRNRSSETDRTRRDRSPEKDQKCRDQSVQKDRSHGDKKNKDQWTDEDKSQDQHTHSQRTSQTKEEPEERKIKKSKKNKKERGDEDARKISKHHRKRKDRDISDDNRKKKKHKK